MDSDKVDETDRAPCLNCRTPLVGAFCYQCGQDAHVHRTIGAMWHDFTHGVMHFEGKIWHTLPLLLTKPGELTRRYIHGQRARFISPFALFLFAVFMMFAVIQVRGIHMEAPTDIKEARENTGAQIESDRGKFLGKLAELDTEISTRRTNGQPVTELLRQRTEVEAELNDLPRIKTDPNGELINIETGSPTFDKLFEKVNENPELALYKTQMSAYKFSWLLIPISVPFLWLLFAWRPQYKLYDHSVFVVYSLGFFTLLAALFTVLQSWGVPGWLLLRAFVIIAPIHMYLQMKQAYQLRWGNALLRTTLLLFFALICLVIFMLSLIALGAA